MFETQYQQALEWVEVRIGEAVRPLRLLKPASPDSLLNDSRVLEWNRDHDYMPYWAYLWPGAFMLAEEVAGRTWRNGPRTMEIGCGLGLAGLAGLASGLRVHFTDYDATPLRLVEQSAVANGFDRACFSTGLLDWNEPPDGRFDLILGADVTYERRLVPLVAGVLSRMLARDGEAILASPDRSAAEGLAAALRRLGMTLHEKRVTTRDIQSREWKGSICSIRRKEEPLP